MRLHRLYWPLQLACGTHALPAEVKHHAVTVLRLPEQAEISLFDAQGHAARGVLLAQDRIAIGVVSTCPQAGPKLVVGVGLLRPERADWLVEKLVEVGAQHIHLVQTARAQGGAQAQAMARRLPRWQRLATAAAGQSARPWVPEVHPPHSLPAFLAACCDVPQRFVADLHGAAPLPLQAAEGAVLVGPPGGLTPEELQLVGEAGYTRLHLSQNILRTETAAILATAALLWTSQ